MSNVNKVTIMGRLGRDPELHHTATGFKICEFAVATTRKRKNNNDETEWHNIKCLGRTAEIASEYLRKGDLVYLEGYLQTRSWNDDNQVRHYRTDIIVNELKLMPKAGGQGRQQQQAPQTDSYQGASWSADEDIPF